MIVIFIFWGETAQSASYPTLHKNGYISRKWSVPHLFIGAECWIFQEQWLRKNYCWLGMYLHIASPCRRRLKIGWGCLLYTVSKPSWDNDNAHFKWVIFFLLFLLYCLFSLEVILSHSIQLISHYILRSGTSWRQLRCQSVWETMRSLAFLISMKSDTFLQILCQWNTTATTSFFLQPR